MDKFTRDMARSFDQAINDEVQAAADLATARSNLALKMVLELGNRYEVPGTVAIPAAESYVHAISANFRRGLEQMAGTHDLPAISPALECKYLRDRGDVIINEYVTHFGMMREKALREAKEHGVVRKNRLN